MKKITAFLAAMMLFGGITSVFSSCADNKDDEPALPAAENVAGTYTGDMTCTVMGDESVFENLTFEGNATDDATVEITLPSFGNPPMQVPQISVPDVKVSGSDGTYTLATTNFDTESNGKKISGVVQGTFADNTLDVKINLQYGNMPMP
ncbi:MAG: calycin-like domain-containing protein, partial [Paramuribaculum sp.]|nr:calycin-like domain-containing protein [Paramuribaculum sp.]